MEDVRLDNKRERHWIVDFKDNDGGVDYQKEILHAMRWDIYVNKG